MKIDVAYGSELDDFTLEQLLYMETDAFAYYESLNDDPSKGIIIGAIPTESLKHFKKRISKTLFFMKFKTVKHKRILVGMACISKESKNSLHFHTLFVRALHRRNGIGTSLLTKAMQYAKKMHMTLTLGVNPLNHAALKLYDSLCFKPCRDQNIRMEWNPMSKRKGRETSFSAIQHAKC